MTEIEKKFSTLPDKDRETIISYGASLRLTSLKKCKKEIALVQGIVQQGLKTENFPYAGY